MTSHTCILFDLPPQHDAVENMFRDETQQSVLNVVKGRFWGYFMELNAWLPVTATVRANPRTLDIMAQGAIKALEAFGFTDDELILRAADIHYNEGGEMVIPALRLNVRVIHSKWYSLVVDRGMRDFALEGVQCGAATWGARLFRPIQANIIAN